MSKTTRRSFRSYRYEEADTFATYLSEMAAQGWYLKELRLGMLFEKGEPSETIYDVQVFPKGKNGDCRPEADALEMAEYCEKAGWQLVDGSGKFVIFRQAEPGAVPIVTPEEKYENIHRTTLRLVCGQLLLCLFGMIGFLLFDLYLEPVQYLFIDLNLILTLVMTICSIDAAIRLITLIRKCRRWKSELEAGISPFYGSLGNDGHTKVLTANMILDLIALIGLLLIAVSLLDDHSDPGLVLVIVVVSVFALIYNLYLNESRPNRTDRSGYAVGLTLVCIIFVISVSAATNGDLLLGDSSDTLTEEETADVLDALPLQASDYLTDPEPTLCYEDVTDDSSALGRHIYANLQYDEYTSSLYYDIMTCQFDWTADLIWAYEIREAEEKVSDPYNQDWNDVEEDHYHSSDLSENLNEAERNALWHADETAVYWNEWYVRKGNTVIRIEFTTLPDAEQIQMIATKLGF